MIEPGHKKLSIRKQARLLGVNRNRLVNKPHPPRAPRSSDQEVLDALDKLHTRWPFYGQRKLLRVAVTRGLSCIKFLLHGGVCKPLHRAKGSVHDLCQTLPI